jgi:putative acyl-CoA dehydrogenase
MRMALAQALHHARHRTVFERHLADHALMRSVLADMALEVEAATALVLRLCRSYDRAAENPHETARARLLTPAVKYWVCKCAPALICEAMECLGGNGYVEESVLPRLYREAPVNAIWEGSGNVMCLDVLRAFSREREAGMAVMEAIADEVRDVSGGRETATLLREACVTESAERVARTIVGRLAMLAAAAALRESAPAVAEIYARTRLRDGHNVLWGSSNISAEEAGMLTDRALP